MTTRELLERMKADADASREGERMVCGLTFQQLADHYSVSLDQACAACELWRAELADLNNDPDYRPWRHFPEGVCHACGRHGMQKVGVKTMHCRFCGTERPVKEDPYKETVYHCELKREL